MSHVDDAIGGWLDQTPDAHRARLLDPDFAAAVHRLRGDLNEDLARQPHAGTVAAIRAAVAGVLQPELAPALERITDRADRTRELARRPAGPTLVPAEPDMPGWHRARIPGRPR